MNTASFSAELRENLPELAAHNTDNENADSRIVLYPDSVGQIAAILKLANKYQTPVQVVSTGRNWGYSTEACSTQKPVLLRLHKLNKIIRFDDRLGIAHIEPGVTQGMLSDFLVDSGDCFYPDMTAAGPDTSIIGNLCDRGFGNSALGNRSLAVLGFDVVLANGNFISTDGDGYFPGNSEIKGSLPPGPNLTQIFVQSNFGIIVGARILLNRRGVYERILGLDVETYEGIPEVVEKVAKLKQQGVIPGCMHIASDLRIISNVVRVTRKSESDLKPLTSELRDQLKSKFKVSSWTGFTLLSGPKTLVKAQISVAKFELRGLAKVRVVNPKLVTWCSINLFARLEKMPWLSPMAKKMRRGSVLFEMLRGRPSAEILYNTGWRRVEAPDRPFTADELDEGQVGMRWYAPSVPLRADRIKDLLDFANPIFEKYGFDALLMFTCITDRMGCGVFNLLYDPRYQSEVKKAASCLDELINEGIKFKFVPYRLPSEYWPWLKEVHPHFKELKSVKDLFDPNNILAPGRYGM